MILTFNVIFAIGLILSYLASFVSSGMFWLISFFGISFPILLAVNFLFFIYWCISAEKWFLISMIPMLIGFPHIAELIQFNIFNQNKTPHTGVKIMTYNVRLFDFYKINTDEHSDLKIFDLIKKEAPDFLCLQEFYSSEKMGELNSVDSISNIFHSNSPDHPSSFPSENTDGSKISDSLFYFSYPLDQKGKRKRGIAIFSKYPIVGKGKLNLKSNKQNTAIYCDVKLGKDTIRIYNVHLQSIRFQKQDYHFMENINKQNVQETDEIEGSQKIFTKLKKAFIKRGMQADLLRNHIQKSPYKVIVCGDFNDTPSSYSYHTISKRLKDACIESGSGFSQTYSGIFPSFRIDYILFDPSFSGYGYKTIRQNFSDHYPVITFLKPRKP